jgi:hypothetical protein
VYFSTLRCHLHVAQQNFDRIANFDAQPPIFTVKDLPIQPIADMKPNLPSGTVTFLFTDIESSTELWERYPEAMKAALARHDAILHEIVEAHHGRIIKTMGDSIHACLVARPAVLPRHSPHSEPYSLKGGRGSNRRLCASVWGYTRAKPKPTPATITAPPSTALRG